MLRITGQLRASRHVLGPIALAAWFVCGCSGPDHLTDVVIAEGGSYFASFAPALNGVTSGGSTSQPNSSSASGGSTSQPNSSSASGSSIGASGGNATTGGSSASGGSSSNGVGGLGGTANGNSSGGNSSVGGAASFNWGTSSYNVTGGNNVAYQGHYTGMACISSCHNHAFTAAGTVYQSNGTSTASNAQLGIVINGALTTTYSGSQGNFYVNVGSNVNWSNAQIAIRTASGTLTMPVNSSATGNCNNCHNSSNRIVVP